MTSPSATVQVLPNIDPRTSKPVPPSVDDLPVYSENGKGYLVRGDNNDFVVMNTKDLGRHLQWLGFSSRTYGGRRMSDVEEAIHRIQTTKSVAYAGPLAGKPAGIHHVAGKRILVTGGPKIIHPDASVKWPTLKALIEQTLGREAPEQLVYFYGWLKHGYTSLAQGHFTQGQVLTLAGPSDCGKSLLQQITREVLGGREANPYPYMMGKTQFNRELFGAEVLMFGDEVASTDYRNRVKFGAYIKQFVVNATQRCHGKGREAVTLDPWWRMTVSLNDEPAGLDVLPPLSQDSLADKIMLLKVVRPILYDEEPWRTNTRNQNWSCLMAELPGLLAHLVNFEIPRELIDIRLGIRAYRNPDLLVTIGAASPERRLLELIDIAGCDHASEPTRLAPNGCKPPRPLRPWQGTATEMEQLLIGSLAVREQVRNLCHYSSACGQFLSSLARSCPERVIDLGIHNGVKRYQINPNPKAVHRQSLAPRDVPRPGHRSTPLQGEDCSPETPKHL